ncbi:Crp/Fnr family transcriptional regulator [bacterium]|nr:Crp/Fnr family transcriptional regulator [bacterium]
MKINKASFDLSEIPLFLELSDEELKRVYSLLKRKEYQEKGYAIIVEGHPGDAFYMIESGMLKVTRQHHDGRIKIINLLTTGDVFGEMALLDDVPRSATVVTMEPTSLLVLNKRDFIHLITETSELALKIISTLSQRLRNSDEQIRELSFGTKSNRIDSLFERLLNRFGVPDRRGIRIPFHLSQQELADMSATRRETICRHLNDLKDRGLLAQDKNQHLIFLNKNPMD